MEANADAAISYIIQDADYVTHSLATNFDPSIGLIFHDEGGYAERENEPGGAGKYGISFTLFKEMWVKESKLDKPILSMRAGGPTFEDLKALTEDEASYLYKTYIFPEISFNELPLGVDYVMINLRTMQGATGAKKIFQESMALPITGKFDYDDWDAIHKADPYKLVAGLLLLQTKLKMNDPRVGPWKDSKGKEWGGFGPGWGNRIWRVWNRAIGMMEAI